MTGPDALATIAEIEIAIAGFSGVAAVLGRRSQGDWTPEDSFSLQALLFSSFTAVVFSFVPIVLLLSGLSPSIVWATSSGAWLTTLSVIAVIRWKEAHRISRMTGTPLERSASIFFALLALVMLALHGLNVTLLREPWPYVGAAVGFLGVPFFFFVRLLRAILRPDVGAA